MVHASLPLWYMSRFGTVLEWYDLPTWTTWVVPWPVMLWDLCVHLHEAAEIYIFCTF